MEPNGPFQMQYYDQGHGNSNGFPQTFSQSPSISSPNNSMSNPAAYAYRPMENGISRYMNESFDNQNFAQHPSQYYQQPNVNQRRNDFPVKSQQIGGQNFLPQTQIQQPNFATRDSFSSGGNFNSFMPTNMKDRMVADSDMFTSSAPNFSQVRQNPINSMPRDVFSGQMGMGVMENAMMQPGQMSAPPATSEFQQPFQQQLFPNRQDFARSQFYPQEGSGAGPAGGAGVFPNNGIRPDGFNPQFPQSPSPQTPTQGPMEQRPPNMFGRAGSGFPANQAKRNENSMTASQPPIGDSQRQAAMMAAAAAVRAAAVASNRQGRDFPPTSGFPSTYQYGPRPYLPGQDMAASPFSTATPGMSSPMGKDLSAVSPLGHGVSRHARNSSESPMNQGSMSSRNSSNSLSFSPNIEQSSPGFAAQVKMSCSSPNAMKTAPLPETLRPGSGSDHSKFSDTGSGEVPIKREPNLGANCSLFSSENDSLGRKIASKTDVDDIVNTVSELEKEAEVKVKKEADQKSLSEDIGNEDKPLQDEREKNLLTAPSNRSSAPPTPMSAASGISPSPSPLPDDLDPSSISPSWPNTPTSPTARRLLQSQSPARFDQLSKLYDLSEDEERRTFLDKYLAFMSVNGTPVTKVPVVCKRPLDLYRLFRLVLERGGIQEVLKKKQFREVLKALNMPSNNSSLAYTVKNNYTKYLLAFESKMKGMFLKAWQSSEDAKPTSDKNVPTIALNDTIPTGMKDLNQTSIMTSQNMARSSQGPAMPDTGLRDWQQVNDANNQAAVAYQMANRLPGQMPFSQNNAAAVGSSSFNQTRPTFGRTSYANNSPDMSGGGYGPMTSFMRFQRPNPANFPRNPNQPYAAQSFPNPMQQNPLSPSWPRNYAARQDQDTPWPTNKGPNIPLKPKRSSTPGTNDLAAGQVQQKPALHANVKRESLTFPSNSVENTKPMLTKRAKLTSKELGPVEAWRIMMSLKSGMLSECTWAIDTLNILLHDDKTISYFHLPQLPGLLDTLMDHFRRCCIDAFGLLDNVEAPIITETDEPSRSDPNEASAKERKRTSKEALNGLWVGVVKNSIKSYTATVASYCVPDTDKDTFYVTENTWKDGGADDTSHIEVCFPRKQGSGPAVHNIRQSVERVSDDGLIGKENGNAGKADEGKDAAKGVEMENGVKGPSKRKLKFLNSSDITRSDLLRDSLDEMKRSQKFESMRKFGDKLLNHVTMDIATNKSTKGVNNSLTPALKDSGGKCKGPAVSVPVNGTDVTTDECEEEMHRISARGKVNKSLQRTPNDAEANRPRGETACSDDKVDNDDNDGSLTKQPSNLDSFETFKAMTILEDGLLQPKVKLEEAVGDLCSTLELDLDYTKQYLDTSKEFIGYLKNRLTSENRGKVPCQEAFTPENSPFCSRTDTRESIVSRLVSVSNIFRSLSFVSGNDNDLANHPGLLLLIGRLLLYRHEHPVTDHSEFRLTQEDSDVTHQQQHEIFQDDLMTSGPCLEGLRSVQENILVILANVAGQIDLSRYSEKIVLPLLDGLLHWVVCKSSAAIDPMPTAPSKYALSPKRLALETLAKLSITDSNVDLILATPPVSRLNNVFKELVKAIGVRTSIPVREFAVVVLDNLAHGENIVPLILEQKSCVNSVLLFLEEAERNTSSYVSAGGVVQPGLSAEDVCGTSVNMLRRAADILLCLTRGSDERSPFLPYIHRLLSLATSQMMDTSVLKILSEIMFELR
eukprot:gene399-1033_t